MKEINNQKIEIDLISIFAYKCTTGVLISFSK